VGIWRGDIRGGHIVVPAIISIECESNSGGIYRTIQKRGCFPFLVRDGTVVIIDEIPELLRNFSGGIIGPNTWCAGIVSRRTTGTASVSAEKLDADRHCCFCLMGA